MSSKKPAKGTPTPTETVRHLNDLVNVVDALLAELPMPGTEEARALETHAIRYDDIQDLAQQLYRIGIAARRATK